MTSNCSSPPLAVRIHPLPPKLLLILPWSYRYFSTPSPPLGSPPITLVVRWLSILRITCPALLHLFLVISAGISCLPPELAPESKTIFSCLQTLLVSFFFFYDTLGRPTFSFELRTWPVIPKRVLCVRRLFYCPVVAYFHKISCGSWGYR